MKKTLFFFVTIFLSYSLIYSQKKDNYFFNSFIVGSSVTYRGIKSLLPDIGEYTWNFNVSTSLGKRFFSGFQVLNIFIDYKSIETERYTIFGWFTQYNIAPYSKFRPFLEISANIGNYYYPTDSYYPEKDKHYFYAGAGAGADMPLSRISENLFLDLSFIFYYQKTEKNKIIYDYNQYIIGINYRFGKYIKKPPVK